VVVRAIGEEKTLHNLNPKKSQSYDEISSKILKELPKKAHTHIYNVIFRTEYVPEQWKWAQVNSNHVAQTRKPSDNIKSYQPISLVPSLSKLLEKLLLKHLKPIIEEKTYTRTPVWVLQQLFDNRLSTSSY